MFIEVVLNFDSSNPNWDANSEYRRMYLTGTQNYLNDKLKAQGHLFLNEVYDALLFPHTRQGAVHGWVSSPDTKGVQFKIEPGEMRGETKLTFETNGNVRNQLPSEESNVIETVREDSRTKYRLAERRPVVFVKDEDEFEAMRFTSRDGNVPAIANWITGLHLGLTVWFRHDGLMLQKKFENGPIVKQGQWIVRGLYGIHIVGEEEFAAQYEYSADSNK